MKLKESRLVLNNRIFLCFIILSLILSGCQEKNAIKGNNTETKLIRLLDRLKTDSGSIGSGISKGFYPSKTTLKLAEYAKEHLAVLKQIIEEYNKDKANGFPNDYFYIDSGKSYSLSLLYIITLSGNKGIEEEIFEMFDNSYDYYVLCQLVLYLYSNGSETCKNKLAKHFQEASIIAEQIQGKNYYYSTPSITNIKNKSITRHFDIIEKLLELATKEDIYITDYMNELLKVNGRDYINILLPKIEDNIKKLSNDRTIDILKENKMEEILEICLRIEEVPRDLLKYSKREELDLIAKDLKNIPEEVSKLQHLKVLKISGNLLKEIDIVCKLKNLQVLAADANVIEYIPENLYKLNNLIKLDLSWNQIRECPKTISKLEKLTELNLGYNKLSKYPQNTHILKNLEALDVGGNKFRKLPYELFVLTNLEKLGMSKLKLASLPDEIKNLKKLKVINISGNNFKNIDAVILKLQKLPNLNSIDISDSGLKKIPRDLNRIKNLRVINISKNPFEDITQTLIKLSEISELRELDLSGSCGSLEDIPSEIAFLINIEKLNLSNNKFKRICSELTKLTKLKELNLRHNNISKGRQVNIQNILPHTKIYF